MGNVDIMNLQYNADKMMKVATALGFEDEDLEDLGIDLEESCNGNVYKFKFADYKALDKVLNNSPKLKAFEDKLKCHPTIQDEVKPIVEFIWNVFPFTMLCAECRFPLEFFCVICNPCYLVFCWCYYPFLCLVVEPWNLFWVTLMSPVIFLCYPCWWCTWTTYYIVTPP